MSKIDEKNTKLRKEIGLRFKEFRKSIKMTRKELANELSTSGRAIEFIENGKSFPLIKYQNYLNRQYQLNINWLLTGKEAMILKPGKYLKDTDLSKLFTYIDEDDPRFEQYVELKKLMQIPNINRVIFAKLESLKVIAKEDIKEFLESNHVDQ